MCGKFHTPANRASQDNYFPPKIHKLAVLEGKMSLQKQLWQPKLQTSVLALSPGLILLVHIRELNIFHCFKTQFFFIFIYNTNVLGFCWGLIAMRSDKGVMISFIGLGMSLSLLMLTHKWVNIPYDRKVQYLYDGWMDERAGSRIAQSHQKNLAYF